MKLYLVFSAFISRQNFLLANNKYSVFFSVRKINLSFASHKCVWGIDVQLQLFLTSALDGGEWLASDYGRLSPGEELLAPTE
jgi:hypothetical protein